ncbi:sterol desaturase family protein [Taibaiella chishuiensis]|uniref:Sterol desaturase/sphingolipid hydroxylase (Fatty acid hydroxylase superfamily) n=1 Tax=Taibaiella chishuiensis TaxID=1434707 RepID=A0A2P8D5L9_9BACT|nr:sterol desaturase family protein [Taibaiella chishuiensis]PSK92499.1 sterol desaturase/sphingolipid hydroxylase (fatty acid hydroxylase superfamily) [Taibaiella chishuiensis]
MIVLSLFGAEQIPLDLIHDVEKKAPNLILWAVPFMVFFSALEIFISYKQDHKFYEKKETIGSILVGLGNLVVSALVKVVFLYLVVLVYNFIPWRMSLNWWTLIPCYILYDLCSYWAHRISHEQRFWWATHVAHHSGEHYNLTVSFRLSWIQHIKVVFFMPLILLGFHPIIFFVTNQIAVLFQFWVHTEYIRKCPKWVEYIFATPSNHRVHHGSQEQYIDKNYGATFIFWDRIWKTYEPEDEPVIYGITTNIENKANPFHINFHEYKDMLQDVRNAKGLRRKLFFIFGSPVKIMMEKKRLEEAAEAELKETKAMAGTVV